MKLVQKFNDRNLDGIFKLMLPIYEKNMKKMCQNLCRII